MPRVRRPRRGIRRGAEEKGEVAGDGGVEPPRTDPESAVLPLDESPSRLSEHSTGFAIGSSKCEPAGGERRLSGC